VRKKQQETGRKKKAESKQQKEKNGCEKFHIRFLMIAYPNRFISEDQLQQELFLRHFLRILQSS